MKADPEGVRALARAVGGLPLGLSLIAGRLLESAGAGAVGAGGDRGAQGDGGAAGAGGGGEGRKGTLRAIVEMSVTALRAG